MIAKPLALLAALAALSACASTDHGTRAAGQKPSNLQSTEASMWYQMEDFEKSLRHSGRVIDDPVLQARVSDLACTLSGAHCADLRVYIVREPSFNASMAPNGMMLVHSGLLLRAETIDEVAFVLGHEFGHFLENHSLEQYAAMRNANITGAVVGSLLAGAGGGALSSIGYVAGFSSAFAFSREQELEADRLGLEFTQAAGFDPVGAAAIWKNLYSEMEATSNRRKAKDLNRNGMFDTHPMIQERIRFLDSTIVSPPQSDDQRRQYRELIRPHLKDWLLDTVAGEDYGASLALSERMLRQGEDIGILQYARARVFLMRGETDDKVQAESALLISIGAADAPAEAYRELAAIQREKSDTANAAQNLRVYLEKTPDAADRALVEAQIIDLEDTIQ